METWRFESVSTAGTIARGQMGSMDKENNIVFDLKSDKIVNQENAISIENQMFGETCFPQIVGSSSFNPVFATHNAFFEEYEPSSAVESNSRESGLFDLELDRIFNQENSQILSSSKITNNLNSSKDSMPSKQTRIASSNSPSPICQVHGCNKSLMSCKDYHKKHKVCELHSKSAKVIVNGIVQRFCQQCSRFHLLSEFDDGKRSCRKRLADHNQRRRKITRYGSTRGRSRATSSSMSMWDTKLENKTQLHSESLPSCNSGLQYPSFHGSNSNFNPFYNKHQTGGTNGFMVYKDLTSAPSLLSSQSQGGSSCHYSSRNPETIHGSSNLNPLVGCEYVNPETRAWSGNGSGSMSTIDLLQLSSELDRVEHQKQFFGIESSTGFDFNSI